MKLEFSAQKPEYFKEEWPGQYDIFHWFELVCGIPHILFMITTYKENGKSNACFHSWSSFFGDGGGFYAVMPGVLRGSHTYENIMRTKEFCVNFISQDHFDGCLKTIEDNSMETDEFAVGGFTLEPATSIHAPRIKESFLTLECRLELEKDLSQKNLSSLIIGKVTSIAMEDTFAAGFEQRYGEQGFMFNIHKPKNPLTATGDISGIGLMNVFKKY